MISDLEIVYFWPKRLEWTIDKKGRPKQVKAKRPPVCFNPPGAGGVKLCSNYCDRLCPDIEHVTCTECRLIWTSRIARAMWGA